jgi:hypothetical protein
MSARCGVGWTIWVNEVTKSLGTERKVYAGTSWGAYCFSLPREWIKAQHPLAVGSGVEIIDVGTSVIFVRFAGVCEVNNTRPWEVELLPLSVVRQLRARSPLIRKDDHGQQATVWYARVHLVGGSRKEKSLVTTLPESWVEKHKGTQGAEHLWVHSSSDLLAIALEKSVLDKLDGDWRGRQVKPLTRIECDIVCQPIRSSNS